MRHNKKNRCKTKRTHYITTIKVNLNQQVRNLSILKVAFIYISYTFIINKKLTLSISRVSFIFQKTYLEQPAIKIYLNLFHVINKLL